ncbi:MAG TPA: desulfoferrodoxin family protein [Bacillota bacterium]|jgi:superoxide reductase|nr:desulfoferrodoxin Dfx [Fastidiosipila sp.]HPX93009.1 desulfoferrodoxin family protein [Bacillota bacterium]HQB80823.1 desulfoferrodoxin family protein [Bacillota bacterium]
MKDLKFYYCQDGDNLAYMLNEGSGKMVCCGEPMSLLHAGTTDTMPDKHIPRVTREAGMVHVIVGEEEHPMTPQRHISWIAAAQGDKVQFLHLHPGDEPKASFHVEEGPVQVYGFCNLHGLWMTEA